MLRLQDVFKKTAKHLNSQPGHHTLSFSHHAPFHFFRLLNRPKWQEFEEMTLCHYGKLTFANSSFGASLKIDKIVRPENVWTNISCQICNCRIGITESPNPHGILRKRPKAARKSLGNGASITISCWLKSVDDDQQQQQQQRWWRRPSLPQQHHCHHQSQKTKKTWQHHRKRKQKLNKEYHYDWSWPVLSRI